MLIFLRTLVIRFSQKLSKTLDYVISFLLKKQAPTEPMTSVPTIGVREYLRDPQNHVFSKLNCLEPSEDTVL